MNLNELKKNWDAFGKQDPMWAILSDPAKKGNKWNQKEFFNSGQVEIDSVFQYIESLDVFLARRKALDFGCGLGRNTQALSRYFDECVGVDIALSMIQLAQKYSRFNRKCKYYVNDSDSLNAWQDNYFDFIYSRIVLQHIQPDTVKIT
jgi:2-polyprenyl-3-methyl-5-hydroxy-6-metoxy-1,4-benzoquinol methylase